MSSDDHQRPRFHRGVTFFLALLLSLSACFMGSALSLRGALVLQHPAETAREHFERTIELEAALENEPAWLRRPLWLFLGRVRPALSEGIDAYDEVVELQASVLRDPKPDAPPANGAEPSTAPAQDANTAREAAAPGSKGEDGAPVARPNAAERSAPASRDAAAKPSEPASRTDAPADPNAPSSEHASARSGGESGGAPSTSATPAGDAQPASPGSGFGCAPTAAPQLPPKDSRVDLSELLARRAILQGEAERLDDVLLTAVRVENLGLAEVARAIRYAYQRLEPRTRARFADFDLSALKPGWARDRLELRLAQRTGETQRATELEDAIAQRGAALRSHAETIVWSLLVPAVLGLLALLVWLAANRPELPRANASIPPEWTFEDGLAVLLRSLVFGFAVLAVVGLASGELFPDWTVVLTALATPIPLFVLVQRGLIAPRVLSFVRVLGLDAFPGGAWKWIAIVLGLFAADQLGQALVLELCGRIGLGLHWTEPVPEALLSMPALAFAVTFVVGIAWDPIVSELTRRGVLFLTLRARMPALSAALWSAALVAAFHNGSLPTFLMLFWSGFLYAWTFETTRSLLPAIVVQVLSFAASYGAIATLYR